MLTALLWQLWAQPHCALGRPDQPYLCDLVLRVSLLSFVKCPLYNGRRLFTGLLHEWDGEQLARDECLASRSQVSVCILAESSDEPRVCIIAQQQTTVTRAEIQEVSVIAAIQVTEARNLYIARIGLVLYFCSVCLLMLLNRALEKLQTDILNPGSC